MLPDKLSILLVEDNPADARLIEVLFSTRTGAGVTVRKAETLGAALAILREDTWSLDMILLDLNLPDSESLETLHAVAAHAPDLPIVVLSGHTDENLALAAVREGAQDYLVKGRIEPELLNRAARYAIERKRVQRDRDKAMRELAASEERLRLVIDASSDGIWDWNIAEGQILWSDRVYELLRRRRERATEPSSSDFRSVHPDDRAMVAAALRDHMERALPYMVECRLMRGDGSYGYFRINGKTVRNAGGEPVRMAGSISDITERRRAEDALRASEQRFQLFMDNSPAVAFMKDEHGRYVYINAVFQRLFGHRSDVLLGKTDVDVWPADVAERLRATDARVLATNAPIELTEVIPQEDGLHEWLTVKFPTIESANRRYVCGVGVDITERRRAENALREADEKLRQSQKMEAVGQLASGIAHDFNNLLTAIRGYASLARNTLSTGHPALESLDQVEEASRQASGVASALLTFARKNHHTEKVPVHVASTIESAARLFRRTLPPSVLLVLDTAAAEDLWINADSTQLHQVLINLGLNARDAIGREGTLTISLQPAKKDGTPLRKGRGGTLKEPPGAVNIVVRDTGSGMTPDIKARIFEPFFTTKPRGRGTGLGLAVIHGIVQDHNAAISVESTPGKGSTFTVTFATTAAQPRREESNVPAQDPIGSGLALLAEHNPLVRGLLASMLAALGYQIVHASNTKEAIASAERPGVTLDLLVTDVDLPGDGGGAALLKTLKDRGHNVCAIVVAATSTIEGEDLGCGVVVLKKPFQLTDLRHALSELTKETKAGNPP